MYGGQDTPTGQIQEGFSVNNHVYKKIELVGSAENSIEEAVQNAISTAGRTLHHLDWFEICETRGHIVEGKIGHYQVVLKVGFRLDR